MPLVDQRLYSFRNEHLAQSTDSGSATGEGAIKCQISLNHPLKLNNLAEILAGNSVISENEFVKVWPTVILLLLTVTFSGHACDTLWVHKTSEDMRHPGRQFFR